MGEGDSFGKNVDISDCGAAKGMKKNGFMPLSLQEVGNTEEEEDK
tara:strand:- start:463 stop:597 length:135 start_codon:yes stop_codon:yes gene_type:complete